jgi:hypothetical protein
MTQQAKLLPAMQTPELRRLWHDLEPHGRRLEADLRAHLVGYPGPVVCLAPPSAINLGIGGWHPDAAALRQLIFRQKWSLLEMAPSDASASVDA